MRRPRLCLASADSEAGGFPSGPITGLCQRCWLDGDRRAAGNRRAARQPRPRKNGPSVLNPAMERPKGAFCTTKARLSALHLPSKRGDQLKAQLARRRENASAWLFEIRIENAQSRVPDAMRHEVVLRRTGTHVSTNIGALEWAPALQRTASQGLRAALRPGHAPRSVQTTAESAS